MEDNEIILKQYYSRYGGFWVYPDMLDYCYLVNPYFNRSKILEEMEANFRTLVAEYPAGMNVNSKLASECWNIKKEYIIPGNGAAELIKALMENLEGKVGDEDIIVIHDGIRPLVDETVLTDVIMKAQIHGNAVTSLPYNEQIFVVNPENEKTTKQYIPREILRRVSTPQAYKFGKLDWAYHEAFEKEIGIKGSAYTNTMMVELGETLYFAAGSDKNIKLTTKDDLEMFKGYLKKEKDNWLK